MPLIIWVILGSLTGSLVALGLAYLFLYRIPWTHHHARMLVSFAAGVMLTVAFLDLIPESFESSALSPETALLWVFGGFLFFFVVEKVLLLYHCHDEHCGVHTSRSLVITGDTIHNLLDGIAIAVAFLVDVRLGIVTAFAIALHEIPQEIGDLAVLTAGGMPRRKALVVNALSGAVSVVGALAAYFFFQTVEALVPALLAFTGGAFLYVVAADLIPEIHLERRRWHMVLQAIIFFIGALVMFLVGRIAHA